MNHILTFGISELSLHKRNILRKLIQKEDKEVEANSAATGSATGRRN